MMNYQTINCDYNFNWYAALNLYLRAMVQFCNKYLELTKLCSFNEDALIVFPSCLCGWLWKETVCWWWDEDADFEMDRVTADATWKLLYTKVPAGVGGMTMSWVPWKSSDWANMMEMMSSASWMSVMPAWVWCDSSLSVTWLQQCLLYLCRGLNYYAWPSPAHWLFGPALPDPLFQLNF